MRGLSLIVLAALLMFAVPQVASAAFGLPFNLTFLPDGTITGTFGGVTVTGTWSGSATSGTWQLLVEGKVFATGTYACSGGTCTFTGTTLLGKSTTFSFTSSSLTGTFSGSLTNLFRNLGGWVSGVAHWSNQNLDPTKRGKVVSQAAHVGGNGNGSGAAAGQGQGNAYGQDGEHGNGKGKGNH